MQILSNLPGRIRIAHHKLKNNSVLSHLVEYSKSIKGIDSVSGNMFSGSILIYYDYETLTEYELITEILKYSHTILQKSMKFKAHKGDRFWRDIMHGGMISSLVICSVSGFYGPKKIHIITGLLFVLVSAEHTRINRRLLFR